MPKYRIVTTVDSYWDVIIEAEDEDAAIDRAHADFRESFSLLDVAVEVDRVPDETELGDVG